MEASLATALEEEKILGELGETPFDPFKEQEEFMNVANVTIEKQTQVLGNSLFNFFKKHTKLLQIATQVGSSSFNGCYFCEQKITKP
jgi:hypothetical protein